MPATNELKDNLREANRQALETLQQGLGQHAAVLARYQQLIGEVERTTTPRLTAERDRERLRIRWRRLREVVAYVRAWVEREESRPSDRPRK